MKIGERQGGMQIAASKRLLTSTPLYRNIHVRSSPDSSSQPPRRQGSRHR